VANAVEHGLADRDGLVDIEARRSAHLLEVQVRDNGVGFEDGTPMTGLGTQIVRQMVTGELHGSIEWLHGEAGGTVVVVRMPVE
jgi:two-component sensor histidine kinase